MLRKIRIILASIMLLFATILFLDFTGTVHAWLGWVAQIQFLPALLALNVAVVAVLLIITFLFGRVYCSVICPLGIMQDLFNALGRKTTKNKKRLAYAPEKPILRYGALGVFVLLMVLGLNGIAILVAPYSAFGRIAQNVLAPIYAAGNNVLAYFAERMDSYAFYSTDVWIKSIPTFIIALVSLVGLAVLAWRGGRTWCNTVCPVGNLLGLVSRFAWFKPVIDTSKCVNCKMCEHGCKAKCIDVASHSVDASRCVACMNCMQVCKKGAIQYKHVKRSGLKADAELQKTNAPAENVQASPEVKTEQARLSMPGTPARRGFLLACASMTLAGVANAADKTTDGGLAPLKARQTPERETPVKPAGSVSLANFSRLCTGCQLCVSVCPEGVLRPSTSLKSLMQPEMGFERGYCRPECTRCSEVCPAGAIQKITPDEKAGTQIGHAVWVRSLCLPANGKDACGACARQCPNGAISMISLDPEDEKALKIPAIDTARCIGCGACEYVCPARPISAIHIEGHEDHRAV